MNTGNNVEQEISVLEFIENSSDEMLFEVISGQNSLESNRINSPRIQKLGLALAGFAHYIHDGRLQIIGESETSYLDQLSNEERSTALTNLDYDKICCIVITKGLDAHHQLIEIAKEKDLPIIKTPLVSSSAIGKISGFLQKALAPTVTIHGVLLGIYGLGLLIIGGSGIGKSECALDLVTRGHRLISDDVVRIRKIGEILEGNSPSLTRGHLEIRGLGIINIRDLFGVSAIGRDKKIDLCIELKKWEEMVDVDRLGLKMKKQEILDTSIPKFDLPVSSGRNITTLVETAVRIHLLKLSGHDAAKKLIEKHNRVVGQGD